MAAVGIDCQFGRRWRQLLFCVHRLGHLRLSDADRCRHRSAATARDRDCPSGSCRRRRRRHPSTPCPASARCIGRTGGRHRRAESSGQNASRRTLRDIVMTRPSYPMTGHREGRLDRVPANQDAGGRCRIDGDAGDAEPRSSRCCVIVRRTMSDKHWRFGERADLPDRSGRNPMQTDVLRSGCEIRALGRGAIIERPRWRDDRIALRLVAGLETLPALRIEPGTVDQHDGLASFEVSRTVGGLTVSFRVLRTKLAMASAAICGCW